MIKSICFFMIIAVNAFALNKVQVVSIKEAKKLEREKKYSEAISVLKNANNPQSDKILDELARLSHLNKDHLEEVRALEIIKNSFKISPAQSIRLGRAYFLINKRESAVENFRDAIKSAPKYEKAYKALYDFYLEINNTADARLIVMEIIEKFGAKGFWLNEYCRMEIEQKYFDNAKNVCQEAILKDPSFPDNHIHLAYAHQGSGNDDQAQRILMKASRQFPKSENAQWAAGQLSFSLQNWEQAKKKFESCLKIAPKSFRCRHMLGKSQFELGDYDSVLINLKSVCAQIDKVDEDFRRYAFTLSKLKKEQLAKKFEKEEAKCKESRFLQIKKNSKTR